MVERIDTKKIIINMYEFLCKFIFKIPLIHNKFCILAIASLASHVLFISVHQQITVPVTKVLCSNFPNFFFFLLFYT